MSFKNRWTISSSYDFQAHLQRSQRRCCFSQTALLWFEVHPDLSPALPGLSPALPGASRLVVGAPSYSEGRQECPPRVWYSPEIDASKFTLDILSDTPGGFQCLKYILLMCSAIWIIWNPMMSPSFALITTCSTDETFINRSYFTSQLPIYSIENSPHTTVKKHYNKDINPQLLTQYSQYHECQPGMWKQVELYTFHVYHTLLSECNLQT